MGAAMAASWPETPTVAGTRAAAFPSTAPSGTLWIRERGGGEGYVAEDCRNGDGVGGLVRTSCLLGCRLDQGGAELSHPWSPSHPRTVLQSINPAEPHKECPNPKPGRQSQGHTA